MTRGERLWIHTGVPGRAIDPKTGNFIYKAPDNDNYRLTVKETYKKLHGVRPEPGLYDELEIKALNAELADLKGDLIKKEAGL